MENRILYRLGLFHRATLGDSYKVIRVPGGWIMRFGFHPNTQYVFVPYNEEFKNNDIEF